MNNVGFDVEVKKNTGRSGSYWIPNFDNYDSIEKEKSFYVKLEQYVIQDNYVQGGGGQNSEQIDSSNKIIKSSQIFETKLSRPMFRLQFKKWIFSNVGDFIEYEIIV